MLMLLGFIIVHILFPDSTLFQKHVLSLDGPVVTASGFKDELAVVTHASHCLPSNDQVLFSTLPCASFCWSVVQDLTKVTLL